jgi:hypothetical protein
VQAAGLPNGGWVVYEAPSTPFLPADERSGIGMLRSVARSKGMWVAMLAALVLGFALLVVLTSPGSHPKPAQAQVTEPTV